MAKPFSFISKSLMDSLVEIQPRMMASTANIVAKRERMTTDNIVAKREPTATDNIVAKREPAATDNIVAKLESTTSVDRIITYEVIAEALYKWFAFLNMYMIRLVSSKGHQKFWGFDGSKWTEQQIFKSDIEYAIRSKEFFEQCVAHLKITLGLVNNVDVSVDQILRSRIQQRLKNSVFRGCVETIFYRMIRSELDSDLTTFAKCEWDY